MSDILNSDPADPTLWLLAFAASLLCLLATGIDLYFAKSSRLFAIRLAVRLVLLPLTLLVLADALARLPQSWELLGRCVVLALGAGCIVLLFPRNLSTEKLSRWVAWSLAGVSLMAACWSSGKLYAVPGQDENELAKYDLPSPEKFLVIVPRSLAYTDHGRAVSLYEYQATENGTPAFDVAIPDVFEDQVIVAGPPDPRTNCHGWVFTGGEFVVRGAVVDHILNDNGYEKVEEPLVGDLIIHRDSAGVPSHTGIVKATGNDGFVLIESKWGFLGRYLHEPKSQAYSKDFAYYRSPRPDHKLRIEEAIELEYPGVSPVHPEGPRELAKWRPRNTDAKVLGAE